MRSRKLVGKPHKYSYSCGSSLVLNGGGAEQNFKFLSLEPKKKGVFPDSFRRAA